VFAHLHSYIIRIFFLQHALEIPDHRDEILQGLKCSGLKSKLSSSREHFPKSDPLFVCCDHNFFNGGFAYSPTRIIDDAS